VARRKKITADLLRRVPGFIEQGLTASNIADAIGCTVGTLRVKCSQMGISLRQINRKAIAPDNPFRGHTAPVEAGRSGISSGARGLKSAVPSSQSFASETPSARAPCSKRSGIGPNARHAMITLLLPPTIIVQLRERAALRGFSAGTFASMLLETVVRDCLYEAVLDSQEELDGTTTQRGL